MPLSQLAEEGAAAAAEEEEEEEEEDAFVSAVRLNKCAAIFE